MSRIVLSSEQTELVAATEELIDIVDSEGNVLGTILPPKLQDLIAECRKRLEEPGPRASSKEVREMLAALEDRWQKDGPFGPDTAKRIVAEVRSRRSAG